MPYIYKITNLLNGKVYIGQTIKTPKQRMTEHIYLANNPQYDRKSKLHAAMRKYGCDNFAIEVVQACSVNQLDELEIYWIEKYDSYSSGYNNTLGGSGGLKRTTEEFVDLWEAGMTVSAIARHAKADRGTVACHLRSIGITSEDIEARKNSYMKSISQVPVYQYDLDGNFIAEYNSIETASMQTGVSVGSIRGVIGNQHPSAGRFQWKRYKVDNIGKCAKMPNSTPKEVHQYALDGKYLRSFKSLYQARLSVGLGSTVTLRRVLSGQAKQTAGYRWSFTKTENLYDLETKSTPTHSNKP